MYGEEKGYVHGIKAAVKGDRFHFQEYVENLYAFALHTDAGIDDRLCDIGEIDLQIF